MKVSHVLPGLDSGGAERMATTLMRILDRGRFEAVVIGLLDSPLVTDLEEALAQDGIFCVCPLSECRGFDPLIFARLARLLDRGGSHIGLALSLQPQRVAQRAPALDKH